MLFPVELQLRRSLGILNESDERIHMHFSGPFIVGSKQYLFTLTVTGLHCVKLVLYAGTGMTFLDIYMCVFFHTLISSSQTIPLLIYNHI